MQTRTQDRLDREAERRCGAGTIGSPVVVGPQIPFSSEDYAALPDGFPAELIGGRFYRSVPPTIRHQQLLRRVALSVAECVHSERILFAPVELGLDACNVLHPDLVVLDKNRSPGPGLEPASERSRPQGPFGGRIPVPQAVFEVLLEPTADRERRLKAPVYLAGGVKEVWLVDCSKCSLEVLTSRRGRSAPGPRPARSTVVSGLELWPDYLFRP